VGIEVVDIIEESKTRYLTYALSVVTSRAIPDVRDGLKPVQRRIIYAMLKNLSLLPSKNFRKSAAVVGEVLGRYHPHGDAACYEAMVRMAQDFSLRYPIVEGQGNFGSLDGDGAAAYRYTEARLREMAIELLGDIDSNTVPFRENFDQTTSEPVVLPSRIPNLLMNGASGIAVGMATSVPPHNLSELCDALELLITTPDAPDSKIYQIIKGPDFPTGCEILNTKEELREMYSTGRGSVRMRATWHLEKEKPKGARNERTQIVFDSIPYGVDKSTIVEKIADVVVSKKITQVEDVRDESTEEIRVVLEVSQDAEIEKILGFLFKSTPLQSNFPVNLTVLVPSGGERTQPMLLGLRAMLEEFVLFRIEVVTKKLAFEKEQLEERVHVLQGVASIIDVLDKVISEVRKSSSRADAIARLQKVFTLSEKQAQFIVDLRVYQLTRTHLEEVVSELAEKEKRIAQILAILGSDKKLRKEITTDLERIKKHFGDKRICKVVNQYEMLEVSEADLVQDEEVYVIVTRDGWVKRIKSTNDPSGTRIREGDAILFSAIANSKDTLTLFTSLGMAYSTDVFSLSATSGYGEPMQKIFKCSDGEVVIAARVSRESSPSQKLLFYTRAGIGYIGESEECLSAKKAGKRVMRLKEGDSMQGITETGRGMLALISKHAYCLCLVESEVPVLSVGAKGVQLMRPGKDDMLFAAVSRKKKETFRVTHTKGEFEIALSSFTIGKRGNKGDKIPQKRIGMIEVVR
jgi:DNA gyrase subunit A